MSEFGTATVQQPRTSSDLGSFVLTKGSSLDQLVSTVVQRTCIELPKTCPQLTGMFAVKERNKKPAPALEPWAGGYVGSVLSVGSRLYRLTQDPALKKALDDLVNELVNHQTEYGYVGPWPASHQFKKDAPNCETPWDAWGHHRVLVGAHAWSEASKSGQAGMLLTPIADMLLLKFGADAAALHSLGGQSANGAVIDSFATMFMSTDADKFLLGSKTLLKFMELPGSGDLVKLAAAKKSFVSGQNTRWETLSSLEAFAKLGQLGEEPFIALGGTASDMWWSICETSRCANGGLRLGDQDLENPRGEAAPRTCATAAWAALTAEILNLSGSSVVADELELTLFNAAVAASQKSDDGFSFEDVPVDGAASPTTSKLSQQAVTGPLAVAAAADCAVKAVGNSVIVNIYAASTFQATLPSGNKVKLTQETAYPHSSKVTLVVKPSRRGEEFVICIRIPAWATSTSVSVDLTTANQPEKHSPEAGKYFCLEKGWCNGDRIEIDFDFAIRFRKADTQAQRVSMYYGPLLLAVDRTGLASQATANMVAFSVEDVEASVSHMATSEQSLGKTTVVFSLTGDGGQEVLKMCDYASACQISPTLITSIEIKDKQVAVAFSQSAPMRTFTMDGLNMAALEEDSMSPLGDSERFGRTGSEPEYTAAPRYSISPVQPLATRQRGSNTGTPARRKSQPSLFGLMPPKSIVKSSIRTRKSSATISAPAETVVEAKAAASSPLPKLPPNHPDYVDPSTNPANAPAEEDLKDLFEAKAMQEKLRLIKLDMEQKASAVAGDLPYAVGRKTSTRDMLKNATTSPSEEPVYQTASPTKTSEEHVKPPTVDTTQTFQLPQKADAVTEDQGYEVATGEEVVEEAPPPEKQPTAPPSAWKEKEGGMDAKPSWKKSWKNLFKKDTTSKKATDKAAKKELKLAAKANTAPAPATPTTKNPFGKKSPKSKAKDRKSTLGEAPKCHFCGKSVYAMEKGEADGMVFHKNCFRCEHCKQVVKIGSYAALSGKIYCKPHFKQLFKAKGNYSEGFGVEQHKHKWDHDGDAGADTDGGCDAATEDGMGSAK